MKRQPHLQFTDAELSPKPKRHVRRAERAANRAEAAREKIPKDRKKLKRRMIEQQSAKARKGKKHLYFEDVDRPSPSPSCPTPSNPHPSTPLPSRPTGKSGRRNRTTRAWRAPTGWRRRRRAGSVSRHIPTAPKSYGPTGRRQWRSGSWKRPT